MKSRVCSSERIYNLLARLVALNATVVQCLTERKTSRLYQQVLYSDTYAKVLVKSVELLTRNTLGHTMFWAGEDFWVAIGSDTVKV